MIKKNKLLISGSIIIFCLIQSNIVYAQTITTESTYSNLEAPFWYSYSTYLKNNKTLTFLHKTFKTTVLNNNVINIESSNISYSLIFPLQYSQNNLTYKTSLLNTTNFIERSTGILFKIHELRNIKIFNKTANNTLIFNTNQVIQFYPKKPVNQKIDSFKNLFLDESIGPLSYYITVPFYQKHFLNNNFSLNKVLYSANMTFLSSLQANNNTKITQMIQINNYFASTMIFQNNIINVLPASMQYKIQDFKTNQTNQKTFYLDQTSWNQTTNNNSLVNSVNNNKIKSFISSVPSFENYTILSIISFGIIQKRRKK